jgi:hypothetical protein
MTYKAKVALCYVIRNFDVATRFFGAPLRYKNIRRVSVTAFRNKVEETNELNQYTLYKCIQISNKM